MAICKGMTVSEVASIPELSSDHNPVLFEVSLDNFTSPALSTYAFPNWSKFQTILTSTLPGNPKISNTNDIDNAIQNFNSTFKNAINNGAFRDNLGSYDLMFYINSAITALIAIPWIFEPYFLRYLRTEETPGTNREPESV
ncbi:hypothetical protein TNCT_460571 [Trichonephila clavata]|uniref:Uncharacterized protein n=1 Tax=Trichonephila clavata TaxID=2740835 RepID=A0A8X6FBP4_TRICU|nr:hypothetical protein TNCT_460571 [Trichonephila clavata]